MRKFHKVALAAGAAVGIAAATKAVTDAEPHLVRTEAGPAIVRCVRGKDGSRVRVLQQGGVYQSATYLDERRFEPVFEYYRSFDTALTTGVPVHRALMIGGGGYAWPKHVLANFPDVRLDVVEIDPAVTRAALKWFYLDEAMGRWPGRLRPITAEGRAFLEGSVTQPDPFPELTATDACRALSPEGYDAIVVDAFCGASPVRRLATVEAARAARSRLVPDGVYAANVVSEDGGADVWYLRCVVATLSEAFANVYVVPCVDDPYAAEDNYLVLASDRALELPGALPYGPEFLGWPMRDAGLEEGAPATAIP